MKYSNKHKKAREHWTKLEGPSLFRKAILKLWCQQYPSKARFWFDDPHWTGSSAAGNLNITWTWYFEDPQDAIIFKLKFLTK